MGRKIKIVLIVIVIIVLLPWAILFFARPLNARTPSDTNFSKSAMLANPPAPLAKPVTLKIVTFNVHDMYVISWNRPDRMRGIAETIKALDPDIVGLQEAWIEADRKVLFDALAGTRLAFDHYYPSGLVGSGLYIVSAFPIREAYFHRYIRNGKWYKPYHGDWWSGKGAALARVELPGGGCVDFYDTHAHAGYGSNEYDADREAQMSELAKFMNEASTKTGPAFIVGDLNCREGSKAYDSLVSEADLVRMMSMSPRIDNIFAAKNPRYTFELLESNEIDRTITLPNGGHTSLSDHMGYVSTVRITPVAGS